MSPAPPGLQLALDLPLRQALGADDFFVSASNRQAVALIDAWPEWNSHGCVLVGPAASGKSHLVNVWRLRAGAGMVAAEELADCGGRAAVELLERRGVLCVEDIDRGLPDEASLFHLLNAVRERGGHVLLTSRLEPGSLAVSLADLRSRLLALPSVAIGRPDDDLLMAVMIKLFADRQIEIEPGLIRYLVRRTERSLAALSRLVEALDSASLASRRRIGKALAREVLAQMTEEGS